MADLSPTINFGGLASGLDTNTMIDQLMALERQPQNRLKLKQQQIDTRKNALSDIETRLKNLRFAAQDLKSPTLWLDTQSVDVNDATKIAATRTGGAGTGGYQVTVTQLASASQHWYTYPATAPATDQVLHFDYGSGLTHDVTITAGSDITAAANTINSDSDSPVYASVVTASDGTKYLAFSSKTTGNQSDFTVTSSILTEDGTKAVVGVNAQGTVGAKSFDESTNVIADMIPGVSLTLKGVTGAGSPVTVTVGAPAPDKAAIAAKMKAFVDQYNSTIDFIRSKIEEKPVVNPQTTADSLKGVLYGDTALTGLLGQMRVAMTAEYAAGNPDDLNQLTEMGVTTGKSVGDGTLNQDSISGKLSFDQDAFMAALTKDPTSVRKLMGGNTSVSGFAQSFDALLTPVVQTDGTIDQAISGQDSLRRSVSDQIASMDQLLQQKQDLLKQQFAAMETALQQSQSQGQWLSGQLAALNNR